MSEQTLQEMGINNAKQIALYETYQEYPATIL